MTVQFENNSISAVIHRRNKVWESYSAHEPPMASSKADSQVIPLSHRPLFEYSPLPTNHHTRVLKIKPGRPGSSVRVEIEVIDVWDNHGLKFNALSYEWGQSRGIVPIKCEKSRILVTPNCMSALQRIRSPRVTRTLWIDAICIDQENIAERNSQVALMEHIFARCRHVLMWLGEEDETTAEGFKHLWAFAALRGHVSPPKSAHWIHTPTEEFGDYSPYWWRPDHNLETDGYYLTQDSHRMHSLTKLARRSYFTRVWIAQEIILAGDRGFVLCGRYGIPWRCFGCVIPPPRTVETNWPENEEVMNQYDFGDSFLNIMKMNRYLDNVEGVYADWHYENWIPWLGYYGGRLNYVLEAMRHFDATDQRDNIFVGLALAARTTHDGMPTNVPPIDYNLTSREVSLQMGRFLIECTNLLPMVGLEARKRMKWDQTLPSWMPNLVVRRQPEQGPLSLQNNGQTKQNISCLFYNGDPRNRLSTTAISLFTDACIFDTVAFKVTVSKASDLCSDVIIPALVTLATMGFMPCDLYLASTYNQWRPRSRLPSTYLRAVMSAVGIYRVRAPDGYKTFQIIAEAYLAWRFKRDYPELLKLTSSLQVDEMLSTLVQNWETLSNDFDGEEICRYMGLVVEGSGDLLVTPKGVVGTTNEGEARVGQFVVALCGVLESVLLCERTEYQEDEDKNGAEGAPNDAGNGIGLHRSSHYYEIVDDAYFEHMEEFLPRRAEPGEFWPGGYVVERLEIR